MRFTNVLEITRKIIFYHYRAQKHKSSEVVNKISFFVESMATRSLLEAASQYLGAAFILGELRGH